LLTYYSVIPNAKNAAEVCGLKIKDALTGSS
jgi:hypothetical protein